jgi:hypothetical protein
MKNKNIFILAVCSFFFYSYQANAQMELGVQIPYVSWMNTQGHTPDGKGTGFYSPSSGAGIGFQLGGVIIKKFRVGLTFDYIPTSTVKTTKQINIGGTDYNEFVNVSTPTADARVDIDYAIIHNFKSKGLTLYAILGWASNNYYYTDSYGIEPSNGNGPIVSSPVKGRYFGGTSFSLGLGLEYNINYHIHLYADIRFATGQQTNFSYQNVDAYSNGNGFPDNFNPGYLASALGIRFLLGQDHSK